MNRGKKIAALLTLSSVFGLATAGCSEEKKQTSNISGSRSVTIEPGVAGGTIEKNVTVSAKVKSVDAAKRTVTLVDNDGNLSKFAVGPEVQNLDQLHKGDTVTATLKERLEVYVRSGSEEANEAYAAALAAAPKGAKPGAMIAEHYQTIATVSAIDAGTRKATLEFSDGSTEVFPVREDVDLSQYKVGDKVIIHVTSALSVLTAGK
jgi:hypothetical protein